MRSLLSRDAGTLMLTAKRENLPAVHGFYALKRSRHAECVGPPPAIRGRVLTGLFGVMLESPLHDFGRPKQSDSAGGPTPKIDSPSHIAL